MQIYTEQIVNYVISISGTLATMAFLFISYRQYQISKSQLERGAIEIKQFENNIEVAKNRAPETGDIFISPELLKKYNDVDVDFTAKLIELTQREQEHRHQKELSLLPSIQQSFTTKLFDYYNQVLYQYKLTFWFSIVFASIGFAVIISSGILNDKIGIQVKILSVISGIIINSVSALFFVQSKQAQKSVADFFEKLRIDTRINEAKEQLEKIENTDLKDRIRLQLILALAGIQNPKEISELLIEKK